MSNIHVVVNTQGSTVVREPSTSIVTATREVLTVAAGVQGPQGPPGIAGSLSASVCGENISAYQVVVLISGLLYRADSSNLSHPSFVVGVATQSGTTGGTITYIQNGEVSGGSFIAGQRYFAGTSGALTTTAPTTGWLKSIGVAESSSDLIVEMGPTIIR